MKYNLNVIMPTTTKKKHGPLSTVYIRDIILQSHGSLSTVYIRDTILQTNGPLSTVYIRDIILQSHGPMSTVYISYKAMDLWSQYTLETSSYISVKYAVKSMFVCVCIICCMKYAHFYIITILHITIHLHKHIYSVSRLRLCSQPIASIVMTACPHKRT